MVLSVALFKDGVYSKILTSGGAVTFLTNSMVSAMMLTLSPSGVVAFAAGFSVIEGLNADDTGEMNPLYNKVRRSAKVF